MTTTQTLWKQLEATSEDWELWLVLADALDDEGVSELAYACRWCGTRYKTPMRDGRLWRWLKAGTGGGHVAGWRSVHSQAVLPRVVFESLIGVRRTDWQTPNLSLRDAVHNLGIALWNIRLIIDVSL